MPWTSEAPDSASAVPGRTGVASPRFSRSVVPSGLDDIVNHLVPALQERGVYPTEYAGTTLRENLGLATPVRPGTADSGSWDASDDHGTTVSPAATARA